MKRNWYWAHSGDSMIPGTFDWCGVCPNGQNQAKEYCTDIMIERNQITMNDVPCRAQQYLFKFLCEDVKYQSN